MTSERQTNLPGVAPLWPHQVDGDRWKVYLKRQAGRAGGLTLCPPHRPKDNLLSA